MLGLYITMFGYLDCLDTSKTCPEIYPWLAFQQPNISLYLRPPHRNRFWLVDTVSGWVPNPTSSFSRWQLNWESAKINVPKMELTYRGTPDYYLNHNMGTRVIAIQEQSPNGSLPQSGAPIEAQSSRALIIRTPQMGTQFIETAKWTSQVCALPASFLPSGGASTSNSWTSRAAASPVVL